MKKLFALLLALATVLSLAACGNDNQNATEPLETFLLIDVTGDPFAETTGEEFLAGSSVENTYKNEFIGIQCSLNLDWTFTSDAELRTLNQGNAAVIYDMMANHSNNTDTVSVVVEKLSAANGQITEEEYFAAAKEPTKAALTSLGITVQSADIIKLQFAGQERTALAISGDYLGYSVYEYLVAIKCGDYIACVTVCTWDNNTCENILSQFQAY